MAYLYTDIAIVYSFASFASFALFAFRRRTDHLLCQIGLLQFRLRRRFWRRLEYLDGRWISYKLLLFFHPWFKIRQWQLTWRGVIFAVMLLQPRPTSKSTSPKLACWIYAAKRLFVHLLMLITFCRSPDPSEYRSHSRYRQINAESV